MNEIQECPVCAERDWEIIGTRCYEKGMIAKVDEYVARRLSVLFNLWIPGSDTVTLTSLLCGRCGFVSYSPRPTAQEIDAKYRFLTDCTRKTSTVSAESPRELKRARRLWLKCHGRLPKPICRVMDFGGGDGRLMREFVRGNHECYVVDYNPATILGVRRLGSTLEEVADKEKFDMVICSHVIEHVAEPFKLLCQLQDRMADGGVIYIEVPMEIWGAAPLHEEPVTHANFFTVESMHALLARVGLSDIKIRMEGYDHPSGNRAVVIAAFASCRADRKACPLSESGAAATRALLAPGFRLRVHRAFMDPEKLRLFILRGLKSIWKKGPDE